MKYLPPLAYIGCIVGANWAITTFGIVPVGFGLYAPAGVFFAGLTFTFRNLTQLSLGRRWGFLSIAVGAALSYAITDKVTIPGGFLPLAIASGLTFLLSESADALLWTPLSERGWLVRAMFSGDVAGQVVDSMIFLALAFGSWDLLLGQIVGKWWTLIPAIAYMSWRQRAVLARNAQGHLARAD